MSAENDVPLGEGARRYYEQQFGDRIRKVSKGGDHPGRGGGGGGSNWGGRAGIGIAVGVIFIILRIVVALSHTTSYTPPPTYTPPPQMRFEDDQEKRLNELIRQMIDGKQPEMGPGELALEENDLREEDIPLPQGLCYRIHRESLNVNPTPGGRICQLLGEDARKLISKAAEGKALDEKEKGDLIEALNELIRRPNLYEPAAFGEAALAQRGPLPIVRYNRLLLEKCYPKQIVPLQERPALNEQSRRRWLDGARADLAAARRQYEPAKR